MDTGVIVALIMSAGALIGVIVVPIMNRKKTEAEAATMIQDAAIELIKPLKAELLEQRGDIVKLKKVLSRAMSRITYLMGGIAILTQQITKHGDTPEWTPDEWHENCE